MPVDFFKMWEFLILYTHIFEMDLLLKLSPAVIIESSYKSAVVKKVNVCISVE